MCNLVIIHLVMRLYDVKAGPGLISSNNHPSLGAGIPLLLICSLEFRLAFASDVSCVTFAIYCNNLVSFVGGENREKIYVEVLTFLVFFSV